MVPSSAERSGGPSQPAPGAGGPLASVGAVHLHPMQALSVGGERWELSKGDLDRRWVRRKSSVEGASRSFSSHRGADEHRTQSQSPAAHPPAATTAPAVDCTGAASMAFLGRMAEKVTDKVPKGPAAGTGKREVLSDRGQRPGFVRRRKASCSLATRVCRRSVPTSRLLSSFSGLSHPPRRRRRS